MPTIFISYRRADSANITGRLYDRLVGRYGRDSVFKDVDSIPPGARFADYIADSIQASDVALVMIGPRWLDASSGFGRRLDDPADFVRLEVETALKLSVPVIPVLVDGASLPPAHRLPADLHPLLQHSAVTLRPDPDFSRDVERLYHAIEYWQAQARHQPIVSEPPAMAAATAADEAAPGIPSTSTQPTSRAASRPTTAPRPATAVAERADIAAQQRQARQQHGGRFRRSAQALAAVAFVIALVVTLVAALHSLNPGPGGSSSEADATNTALAVRGTQPFTGLGPCDTNPAEQYNSASRYFWIYRKDQTTCVGGSAARLSVVSVSNGFGESDMSFTGLPYYGRSNFPSKFTTTMTIAFNSDDGSASNCVVLSWNTPNKEPLQWPEMVYVCQNRTWFLYLHNGPSAQRNPINVSKPFTVKITFQNSSIGVSLNGVQAVPSTYFSGGIQYITVSLFDTTPGHSITVSNFALTPGA